MVSGSHGENAPRHPKQSKACGYCRGAYRCLKKFIEIVGNDLNTASGITLIYDLLKDDVNDATKRYIIEDFDKVLSLDLLENENTQESSDVDSEMEQYINEMILKRAEAKKAKDFATADAIREELAAKGIVLKDTREGTTWTKA